MPSSLNPVTEGRDEQEQEEKTQERSEERPAVEERGGVIHNGMVGCASGMFTGNRYILQLRVLSVVCPLEASFR